MLGAVLIVLVVVNAFIAGRNMVEVAKLKQTVKALAETQASVLADLREDAEG